MPTKISLLPASTNPPNTADLLPIVQGGVTKQTTLGALFTQLAAFLQSGTAPTYGWATRTMQAKASDLINVKDAKNSDGTTIAGDGVQVDWSGIQAVLNRAATLNTKAVVRLPQGVFNLGTNTLTIPANVTLEGESPESTFINYVGTGTAIDVAGVSQWGLRNFRLGLGSSATIVGIKIRTTAGNSILYGRMENIQVAGASVAGQTGIWVVASGADIISENWYLNDQILSCDKPLIRNGSEGNFWLGLDVTQFGWTNGAVAIDGACNAEFMQARISGLLGGGTNKVGYKQTGAGNIDDVIVDIGGGGNTALNISGTGNGIRLVRPVAGTPLGTVAAGNILMDISSPAALKAGVLNADSGTDGFGLTVTNTASASDKLRIQTQAAGSGPLIQAANNAGSAYAQLVIQASQFDLNCKVHPGTDAGAAQTASGLYAGTGAPNNANGANGDFYFRSDGGAGTSIYMRRAGAWVGIV